MFFPLNFHYTSEHYLILYTTKYTLLNSRISKLTEISLQKKLHVRSSTRVEAASIASRSSIEQPLKTMYRTQAKLFRTAPLVRFQAFTSQLIDFFSTVFLFYTCKFFLLWGTSDVGANEKCRTIKRNS